MLLRRTSIAEFSELQLLALVASSLSRALPNPRFLAIRLASRMKSPS